MTLEAIETPPDAAATPQPVPGWVLIVAPILGAVLFVLILAIGAAVAVMTGHLDLSHGPDGIRRFLGSSYIGTMAVGALLYLAFLFSAWLLLPKRGPASLASYFPPFALRYLWIGLGAALVMVLIILPTLAFLSSFFHINLDATDAEKAMLPRTLPQLGAILFLGAVAAPLVEEFYFRGMFLRWLRKRLGIAIATIINVLAFAVLHGRFLSHPGLGGVVATLALCVPALVLVYLAVRSRSLWPGVITHGVYNGILLSLSYFAPNMS